MAARSRRGRRRRRVRAAAVVRRAGRHRQRRRDRRRAPRALRGRPRRRPWRRARLPGPAPRRARPARRRARRRDPGRRVGRSRGDRARARPRRRRRAARPGRRQRIGRRSRAGRGPGPRGPRRRARRRGAHRQAETARRRRASSRRAAPRRPARWRRRPAAAHQPQRDQPRLQRQLRLVAAQDQGDPGHRRRRDLRGARRGAVDRREAGVDRDLGARPAEEAHPHDHPGVRRLDPPRSARTAGDVPRAQGSLRGPGGDPRPAHRVESAVPAIRCAHAARAAPGRRHRPRVQRARADVGGDPVRKGRLRRRGRREVRSARSCHPGRGGDHAVDHHPGQGSLDLGPRRGERPAEHRQGAGLARVEDRGHLGQAPRPDRRRHPRRRRQARTRSHAWLVAEQHARGQSRRRARDRGEPG